MLTPGKLYKIYVYEFLECKPNGDIVNIPTRFWKPNSKTIKILPNEICFLISLNLNDRNYYNITFLIKSNIYNVITFQKCIEDRFEEI